jgi:hypothetical protein
LTAFLDLAALGKRLLVGSGRGLFDHEREAARPASSRRDDVCFGGEQRDVADR